MKTGKLSKQSQRILRLELERETQELLVEINNQPSLALFLSKPERLLTERLNPATRFQLFLNLNMPKEMVLRQIKELPRGNLKQLLASHYVSRIDVSANEAKELVLSLNNPRLAKFLKFLKN